MNPLVFVFAAMVALVLSIFRLPNDWYAWLSLWQPQWLLLLLMYWGLQVSSRLGVLWAWLGGFFVDALLAEPLGLNGAIFAAMTYVLLRFRERILMYRPIQQAMLVLVFVIARSKRRARYKSQPLLRCNWIDFEPAHGLSRYIRPCFATSSVGGIAKFTALHPARR